MSALAKTSTLAKGMRGSIALLVLAVSLGTVVFAVRVVRHFHATRVELGRLRTTELSGATKARLTTLRDKVFLTLFVSPRSEMPSHMRDVEKQVGDLLAAMKRAASGNLDYQIVSPAGDPDLERYAAHRKVAPVRVRSVVRDGYSEETVWSALTIAYGAYKPALLPSIGPEHLPYLQSLIVSHLEQMERPSKPRYAVARPAHHPIGFEQLTAALAARGDVAAVDLDGSAAFPDDADLLFWLEPQHVTPTRLRELEFFLARGRTAIIAGSEQRAELSDQDKKPMLGVQPTGYDAEALLADVGLHPVRGLVLDKRCEELTTQGGKLPAPYLVRCIGYDQDFRPMIGQPNGFLLFSVPTPLRLDPERLSERGYRAHVLATTSDGSSIDSLPSAAVAVADLKPEAGVAVPKQPLMVWLRPDDPWRGSLIVSASANVFDDAFLKRESTAHERLVKTLLDTLTADDRLVQARAAVGRIAPIPELSPSARLWWRLVCVFSVPAVLLLIAAARRVAATRGTAREGVASARPRRGIVPRVLVAGGVMVVVGVLSRFVSLQADLTQDQLNTLSPETCDLARGLAGEPVAPSREAITKVQVIVSAREHLPPVMRPLITRLNDVLQQVRRAGARLEITQVDADDLTAADRDHLAALGIRPAKITITQDSVTSVQSIYSAVTLERGGRCEVLSFPGPDSLENLEFRLAFAMSRLLTGKTPHIAFASDVPRMSSAEAWEFQQKGLSAPVGTDVYSLARDVLRANDFRVTHVNPREPVMPSDTDVLVWLQPHRDVCAMFEAAIRFLHQGGKVMLAAQHFNMQSRQYPGTDFKIVYWPQPQSPDVEELYFPDIGVSLVREVLFDELKTRIAMESQVNRSAVREYHAMEAALPFLVRASTANYASDSLITRNAGDQAFLYANFFKLDEPKLNSFGLSARPLITTSPHAWTFLWKGGWLPDDLLQGPPRDEHGAPQYLGRVPLALEITGTFPLPGAKLTITPPQMFGPKGAEEPPVKPPPINPPDDPAQPGTLVFFGGSELFKNHRLLEPEFRADHLLLNTVAALALDAPLARVATHRPVARGFDLIAPEQRLRWRSIVLAAFPLLMLAWLAAWRLGRR